MKRKIGFALLSLAMLASCSQEEVNGTAGAEQDVITLGAATGAGTRAAINDLAGLSASTAGVGIYGHATTATDATTAITSEWTTTPLMANVKTTAIDATTGKMSWATAYNYPTTAPLNVKFFAYHPYAAIGTTGSYVKASETGVAPVLNFTLTGQEDLMWATPVIGSRTVPAGVLKFNHQLTQLSFKFVDSEGTFADAISSVSITGNMVGKMNLETGIITDWSGSRNLQISGAIDMATAGTAIAGGSGKEYVLPNAVMVQPELGSFDLPIMIDGTLKTVTIRPVGEPTFKAGKAYLITLRLTGEVPVQLAAEVVPWTTGGVGEGVVD